MTQPTPIPYSGPPSVPVVETEESVFTHTFILHVISRGSYDTAVKIGTLILDKQGTETVDVVDTTVTLSGLEYGITYRVNITATSIDCPESDTSSAVVSVALDVQPACKLVS